MIKLITVNVELLGNATAHHGDNQGYSLTLSSEVNGATQNIQAYWGDKNGLDIGVFTGLYRLVDGKKRAILATRVDFINSVFKKVFSNWQANVTKVVFEIDMEIGKEVGVSVDEFTNDDYKVNAVLHTADNKLSSSKEIVDYLKFHVDECEKSQDDEEPSAFFIFSDTDKTAKKLSVCVLDDKTQKQTTIELKVKANKDSAFIHIEEADVIQVIETDIDNNKKIIDSSGLTLLDLQSSISKLFKMYNAKVRRLDSPQIHYSVSQGCPF